MSIANRLALIIAFTVVFAVLAVFSLHQVSKGALFHQINSLHLKYTIELKDQLRNWGDSPDAEALEKTIKLIRHQPIQCLESINAFDEFVMTQIGTAAAIQFCKDDIAVANRSLEAIGEYKKSLKSADELHSQLTVAGSRFWVHSSGFETAISTTVQFITTTSSYIVILLAIIVILAISAMARSISKIVNRREFAEKARHESEIRYRAMVDNAGDAIYIHDRFGKIFDVNQIACDQLGYTREELLGMSVAQLDTAIDFEKLRDTWDLGEADPSHYPLDLETAHKRKDGTTFPIEVRISLMPSDEGARYVAIARDISDRKEAERGLNFQKHALDEHAIVSIANVQGNITYVNDKFCHISGYSRDELLGQNHRMLKSDEHPPEFYNDLWETISKGNPWHGEIKNFRKNGEEYWVKATIVPFLNEQGIPFQYVAIRTDISQQREFEKTLLESETKFRSLFTGMAQGVVYQNADGAITSANEAAEKILGLSLDQMQGKTSSDPRWKAIQEGGKEFDGETHPAMIALKTGESVLGASMGIFIPEEEKYRWITIDAVPQFKEGDDKPFQAFTTFSDVTRQKEAEQILAESENRYRQIAEVSSDWVWEMDENLKFSYLSKGYRRLTGIDPSYSLGKTRDQITLKEDLEKPHWQRHLTDLNERKEFRNFQYEFVGPDGRKRYFEISGTPNFDKNSHFLGYRGTASDVSANVAAETALEEAKEAADRANLAKSDFLSSMSHELRTPMNAILGFGQMLDFNPKEPLTTAQKGCVDHIIKGGEHLLDLINDILDLAKIEAGKVELSIEDIDPNKVIEECLSLTVGMATNRGIDISTPDVISEEHLLKADYTRFKQVLLNLMSNAIKYNSENGNVTIAFERTAESMLRIGVTDTGQGIPKDRQGELFQAFSRLDAANSEIEGTGIGLVVCKDLVELMNGTIGFESEVGKGSTFWFELPLSVSNAALAQTQDDVEARGQLDDIYGTMLYVEDNPSNLQLMEMIVARIDGLTMLSAHTAELGIEIARSKSPGIIILDINLPGMSGLDAIKELKKYDTTKEIPVLALSAAATKNDIEKGLAAGFKRYLTKPMNVVEVTDAIREALEK